MVQFRSFLCPWALMVFQPQLLLFLPFKELLLSHKHLSSALASWLQAAVVHICIVHCFWLLLPVLSWSRDRATMIMMPVFLVKMWKIYLNYTLNKCPALHTELWLTVCFSNCYMLPCFWVVSSQTVAPLISWHCLLDKNKETIMETGPIKSSILCSTYKTTRSFWKIIKYK